MAEVQQEFEKYPIHVPIEADSGISLDNLRPGNTTIYNGPVIHGHANIAQLAWANRDVRRVGHRNQQNASGYEALAQATMKILEQLTFSRLPRDEQQDVEVAANEVLTEVVQPEPDRGKIRRVLSTIKGVLAPIAMGLIEGTADGADDWARTAIEQLGKHF